MSSSLISNLKTSIEEGRNGKKVEAYEDAVVEGIEEFVKEESFYELPTNEILKIIGKSEIGDIELLCEFISKMSGSKGEESTLLLNVIKSEEATLEECIKILSKFEHSQICQRTSELFNKEIEMPERDFEHEIEELKKEIEKCKNKTKEEKKTFFPPVTEKSAGFESDICKAAENGKLTSVQYLVEQCHADVETKNICGYTPINIASKKGHIDVVKYLYETCHADVETKDNNGFTPINNASLNDHLEVVKYLYETCHADVEKKDNNGFAPINNASLNGYLDIVKYLYETCHADVETKDRNGCSSINNASYKGHFEVVKFLYETCHAKITELAFICAKTDEINEYLRRRYRSIC